MLAKSSVAIRHFPAGIPKTPYPRPKELESRASQSGIWSIPLRLAFCLSPSLNRVATIEVNAIDKTGRHVPPGTRSA